MKKMILNTEIVISSLFVTGFDRIDPLLFTLTIGRLFSNEKFYREFEFNDRPLSLAFSEYITYDGYAYHLKEGYNLDTNVSSIKDSEWSLQSTLKSNWRLLEYLDELDFKEIIVTKMLYLRDADKTALEHMISNKEKAIIEEIESTGFKYMTNSTKIKKRWKEDD